MIIKCGVNGETLDEGQISVCHHCGMPVCEKHGWIVTFDDAFADPPDALAPPPDAAAPAMPQAQAVLPDAAGSRTRPAGSARRSAAVPLPAMHCRDCVDKYHAGAMKRHGWADPRTAVIGPSWPAGKP